MKKNLTTTSKISARYQTVIPTAIRKAVQINMHEELVWHVVRKGDKPIILVMSKPKNWSEYLSGLGKNLWEDIDADSYITNIRKEWEA